MSTRVSGLPHQGRLQGRARVSTFALLLLAALGQIASTVHLGLVAHAVCPEHGEAIHDGSAPFQARRKLVTVASLRTEGPAVTSDPTSPDNEAHDVCGVVCLPRELAPPDLPRSGIAYPSMVTFVTSVRRSDGTPPVSLVRLAPKCSPPDLA